MALTIALAFFLGSSQVLVAACVHTISGVGSGTLGGVPFSRAEFIISSTTDTCEYDIVASGCLIDEPENCYDRFALRNAAFSIQILGLGVARFENLDLTQETRAFLPNRVEIGFAGGMMLQPVPILSLSDPIDASSRRLPLAAGDRPIDFQALTRHPPLLGEPDPGIPTDRGLLFISSTEGPFTFRAIPEPSIAMLGALALLGIARARRRPR